MANTRPASPAHALPRVTTVAGRRASEYPNETQKRMPTACAPALASERFRPVYDARREEDHELAALVARPAALKEQAEQRDVTEERHLVEVAASVARENSADHR